MKVFKHTFDKLKIVKEIINSPNDTGHSELNVNSKLGKFTEYEMINCFSPDFQINEIIDTIAEQYNPNKIKRGFYCLKFNKDEYSNNWFIVDEAKYKFYILLTPDFDLYLNDRKIPYEIGDCLVFDENEVINIVAKSDEQYLIVTMISKLEHNKVHEI